MYTNIVNKSMLYKQKTISAQLFTKLNINTNWTLFCVIYKIHEIRIVFMAWTALYVLSDLNVQLKLFTTTIHAILNLLPVLICGHWGSFLPRKWDHKGLLLSQVWMCISKIF